MVQLVMELLMILQLFKQPLIQVMGLTFIFLQEHIESLHLCY